MLCQVQGRWKHDPWHDIVYVAVLQDTTEGFMRTLPLITDLQSPAMRPRHWEELSRVVGSPLDPHSPAFTLDTMVSFHMEQHAAVIGSMSADAGRQVAIEQTLQVGSPNPCSTACSLQFKSVAARNTRASSGPVLL